MTDDTLTRSLINPRTAPLPATLKGLRHFKVMRLHMRMGRIGTATYDCYDADGQILPFLYAYRSGAMDPEQNYRGFILPGHEERELSPSELIAIWPEWLALQGVAA